jgi:HAE1 family hydrophobic/amphiphilic exporter-1
MGVYERYFGERKDFFKNDHLACRFTERYARLSLFWDNPQKQADLDRVRRELREGMPRVAGHKLRLVGDEANSEGPDRTIVTFRLQGPDSEELERLGAEGAKLLETIQGLTSVSTPLNSAPRQVRVRYDSDVAMKLGVDARAMLSSISWALRGVSLPRYQDTGREIPLIMEYDREQIAGLSTLRDLEVFSAQTSVPLASLGELEFGLASRSIVRRNGKATFTIQAKVDDPARVREISDAGKRALQSLDLPRDYAVGEEDLATTRQEEEFKELFAALILSIVLVYVLMGILFESFLLPFSVLFTIPFAVLGAYWTLYLTGTAMDSVGWIGIIVLVGVVVNNGIVLIDRIHTLRAEGVERRAAVLEGCSHRVRPILMTALTTITGLLPMAVTEPPGQGIDYRALATCVAGGLAFSTVFTLWVVPLAYTLIDDLAQALVERWRWAFRPLAGKRAERKVADSRSSSDPTTA